MTRSAFAHFMRQLWSPPASRRAVACLADNVASSELGRGAAGVAELAQSCGILRTPLHEDLIELIARGLVVRAGHGRGTRYALASATGAVAEDAA